MKFKKYESIENSYREKFISKAIAFYPEITDAEYVIQEKIDGTNLQFCFEPGGTEYKVGKRGSFLKEGENFFDVWNTLEKYQDMFDTLQKICDDIDKPVRFYAELFGEGVQKRIKYGNGKHILLYDMYVNDEPLPFQDFHSYMSCFDLTQYVVPILKYTNSLTEALEYNVDFLTTLNPIDGNWSEGVVIKPRYNEWNMGDSKRFIIKKKSDKFNDIMKVKPTQKKAEESTELIKAKSEFQRYLTENRLLDLFSKHGTINSMNEMGKYIGLMLSDAEEDFIKDYDLSKLNPNDLKKITKSGGKTVAFMLRKHV